MEGTGHVLYTITSKDVLPVSSLVTPVVVKTSIIMAGCAHNTSGLLVIYFASNVFGSLFCSWPRRRKRRRPGLSGRWRERACPLRINLTSAVVY